MPHNFIMFFNLVIKNAVFQNIKEKNTREKRIIECCCIFFVLQKSNQSTKLQTNTNLQQKESHSINIFIYLYVTPKYLT